MQIRYDDDYYGWAIEQAAMLRERRFADLDLEHLVEEVESMGRTERRELKSRLIVLLAHLLKWRYQPAFRGASWMRTIRTQRKAIAQHLKENPSLKAVLDDILVDAYELALEAAEGETGIPVGNLPTDCPWNYAEILHADFWPDV